MSRSPRAIADLAGVTVKAYGEGKLQLSSGAVSLETEATPSLENQAHLHYANGLFVFNVHINTSDRMYICEHF